MLPMMRAFVLMVKPCAVKLCLDPLILWTVKLASVRKPLARHELAPIVDNQSPQRSTATNSSYEYPKLMPDKIRGIKPMLPHLIASAIVSSEDLLIPKA
jgi:hypothetical protein